MHYAQHGARVYAVTHNPGIITGYLTHYAEVRMGDERNVGQLADIIIDCSARPTNYGYVGSRHKYRHATGAPNVLLSTTLLMKEDRALAPWANTEFIMDSYNAEMIMLAHSGHVLRLPQISIEGHHLSHDLLIASERMSLEHSMLEMAKRPNMDLTISERAESIRDYINISDVAGYVEKALKYEISHVRTDAPKTIKQHIEHFAVNHLKDPSIPERISFYSDADVNDHSIDVGYLPNLFVK